MASPPNPAAVSVVTYEYLFYLPSSEQPRPPARRKARGLLSGSCIPGIASHQLRSNEAGYDHVPTSSKRLENRVPCIGYGPTAPG
jgi:hypothetical protein